MATLRRLQMDDGFQRLEEEGQQQLLIPGIPDHVTLDWITPMLPSRTFHSLLSVSRGWEEAILTRQVYDGRKRGSRGDKGSGMHSALAWLSSEAQV
jgi:hypothetical protein